ncbi:MAG: hypothetical protein HY660_16055 [Armatimonadetes bacterium]|nr:hypothetical protein [Armatimonadota bacterium]
MLWNIVPWYLGTGVRIRAAQAADVQEGLLYLSPLLRLLERLKMVMLVGKKAQSAHAAIAAMVEVPILHTYHPSNLFLNRRPDNRTRLLYDLSTLKAHLPDAF